MIRTVGLGVILLTASAATVPAAADEPGWQAAYETILGTIRPRLGEAPWRTIHWETSLTEARHRAAAEGKPIFVFGMAGEPLGCA